MEQKIIYWSKKWIGVDLDGTLAEEIPYNPNGPLIGKPIPLMVERVLKWHKEGKRIKIFTSRANPTIYPDQTAKFLEALAKWQISYLGICFEVTFQKDHHMLELWDDRAIRVEKNTGRIDTFHVSILAEDEKERWKEIIAYEENGGLPIGVKFEQIPTCAKNHPQGKTVPEILEAAAATFRERHMVYGDNYKAFGDVMTALFPNGLKLDSPYKFMLFGLITNCITKLTRYCSTFDTQTTPGHLDSAHDLSVFAAMLQEVTKNV